MTVFRESFDLTAVEAVCGGPRFDDTDLLDTIAALVDQSVVVVDDISGDSRYRLLTAHPRVRRHASSATQTTSERDIAIISTS